jgi:GDPmannose 4,6-dehydratase
MKPRQGVALIFGITGQDGAYLAELLMKRGLEVHGTSRDKEASSCANLHRLGVYDHITLHSVVLSDFRSVVSALNGVKPTYIYNLAAQSSVGLSFEQPVATIDSIMHGTINVLEAMRFLALEAKLYNASSSECFGQTSQDQAADELMTFRPRSPYALAKAASFWAVSNYREAYGLFACSGLFADPASALRHPENCSRRGAIAFTHAWEAVAFERLGLGARIRRRHGADAGVRGTGGLCDGNRGNKHA